MTKKIVVLAFDRWKENLFFVEDKDEWLNLPTIEYSRDITGSQAIIRFFGRNFPGMRITSIHHSRYFEIKRNQYDAWVIDLHGFFNESGGKKGVDVLVEAVEDYKVSNEAIIALERLGYLKY